jgi:hypothetical protein
VASYGRCRASLRSGERCRVVIVTEGADFCPHHLRLADQLGPEMVRRGAVPKKRARPGVEELPVATAMAKAAPSSAISVRPVWLAVECPSCGERSRLRAPNLLARIAAIELLLGEALGRRPESEEPGLPRMP